MVSSTMDISEKTSLIMPHKAIARLHCSWLADGALLMDGEAERDGTIEEVGLADWDGWSEIVGLDDKVGTLLADGWTL